MPALELSWISSLRQWRKRRIIDGKPKSFYLGTGQGRFDQVSYGMALARWRKIEASLEAQKEENRIAAKVAQLKAALGTALGRHNWLLARHIEELEGGMSIRMSEERAKLRAQVDAAVAEGDYVTVLERTRLLVNDRDPGKTTLNDQVDKYLAEQKRRLEHGQRFPGAPRADRIGSPRYISCCNTTKVLKAAWEDEPQPMDEAGLAAVMMTFRNSQQAALVRGDIGSPTFNERIKTMRHFARWLYMNYLIPGLPRDMNNLCAAYEYKPCARAIDLDVIRRIWNGADSRMRTYIALALNCGYYAIDVASLENESIRDGYIFADRHKTGVPTRFKLWPVTRALLEAHKSKHGRLALVGKNGVPLLNYVIRGTKGHRRSKIDEDFGCLCRRLKLKGVSFGRFRDTSSTLIEGIDRSITDLFGGHKDKRMALFYIDPINLDLDRMFANLDAAIDTLGYIYNLTGHHVERPMV